MNFCVCMRSCNYYQVQDRIFPSPCHAPHTFSQLIISFACFFSFIQIEWYCGYSFVSNFYNSALCLWSSSTRLCLSMVHALLLLSSIPLCEHATVCLPILLWRSILLVYSLELCMNKTSMNILVHIFWWKQTLLLLYSLKRIAAGWQAICMTFLIGDNRI